jgi:hypothetical protein
MKVLLTTLAQRVGWLYALALIALFARYLWDNALLVPGLDQFLSTYRLVFAAFDGQLTWEQLTTPHMGHRILIPNLIALFGAMLTRWDVRFDLVINTLLIAGCAALVLTLFHHGRLPRLLGFTAVLAIALITTPVQFFNQIYGFQICIWLMMLSLYAFAYALLRSGPSRLTWLVGAGGAFIAAWSFLAGHLLWALVPVGMWLAGERRRNAYALWLLWAGFNLGLYLWGYSQPPSPSDALRPALPAFLLAHLGGSFSSDLNPLQTLALQNPDQAQIVGLIGLALLTLTLAIGFTSRGLTLRQAAPWLILIGFAIGTGIMLYLGRSLSLSLVISSRYTTLAIPFWIGLLGLMLTVMTTPGISQRLRLIVLRVGLLAAPLLLFLFSHTLYRFTFFDLQRTMSIICLLTPDVASDCPDRILRFPRVTAEERAALSEQIEGLRQRRLSLYGARYLPDLHILPFSAMLPEGSASWQVQRIDETIYPVLFMPRLSRVEQRLYVPDTFERVSLETAAYIPPLEQILETGDPAQVDGAGFAIWIIDETGTETLGYAGIYVPGQNHAPIPVTIDLTPYQGQRVTIRYGTEPRTHPDFDWAMWLDPHLIGQ